MAGCSARARLAANVPIALNTSLVNGTFDTAGYSVTLSGPLSGPGGVTMSDSGTLTLAASNTFGGGTILSAGQINVNNASALGNGPLTIAGGTLGNTSGIAITLSTNNARTGTPTSASPAPTTSIWAPAA